MAHVDQQLNKYMGVPQFVSPGPAFNAHKASGTTMFNIPFTSSIPQEQILDGSMAGVAKRYGIKFQQFANQGQESQWVQGVNQAINEKVNLINLSVADPRVLQPQLAQAQQAGIKTVSNEFYDSTQVSQAAPHLTLVGPHDFTKAARLEADWVIKDTKGAGNVVVIYSSDVIFQPAMLEAIKAEFAQYCPGCHVTPLSVPGNAWATKIQPDLQAALAANPNINYVIPVVDPMTQFVVPAITSAGRIGKVFVSTFNGTPAILKYVQQGNIVKMDVGENTQWIGWALMDNIMRLLSGVTPVKDEPTPLRVFTKANAADAGTPPQFNKGLGASYVPGYLKVWSGK